MTKLKQIKVSMIQVEKQLKNTANKESNFNLDSKYNFYIFYKKYDEFEGMSLDCKHNKMKEFKRLLNNFKNFKLIKQETQLKKSEL